MDEFHHAAAATYRRLLDYFDPRFLLCFSRDMIHGTFPIL